MSDRRLPAPKPQPEQFEIRVDGKRLREGETDLGFVLISETGIDFDRIEAEKRAAEIAKAEAERLQLPLF